jgi:hypothetical protein
MPLTHYALDTFVAPKMSSLTNCGMPQLKFSEVPYAGVVLNQIFAKPRRPEKIRLLTNLYRWVDAAFVSYATAREYLTAYTCIPRGEMRNYFRALWYIEQCIARRTTPECLATIFGDPVGKNITNRTRAIPENASGSFIMRQST